MSETGEKVYEFDGYRMETAEQTLRRGAEVVPLTPKAFDLLRALVENHGRLMGKDELIKILWAESFVEDANLNVTISALRRALGEKPHENRFIETVPRRGYRFVAAVREIKTAEERVPAGEVLSDAPTLAIVNPAKICPKCRKTYFDRELNFCLDDGAALQRRAPRLPSALSLRKRARLFLLAIMSLSLLTLAGFWARKTVFEAAEPNAPEVRTLAVLPFRPLAGSETDGTLEIGMADALITKLSGLDRLAVRPTSAVARYSGGEIDPLAAGRELQVEAVLDGKIQRAGDKIRVSVQLVRVGDGATLWADSFDDFFTNIFAVQDSISEKMTASLRLRLSGRERERLTKRYTENTEAYELYLKGRYHQERISADGTFKAVEYFRQALDKDPDFVLAHATLPGPLTHLANLNIDREANLKAARRAAERAVELDPQYSGSQTAMAVIRFLYDWDFAAAEKSYRKAVELDPNASDPRYAHALFLSLTGRHDEAIHEMEIARRIDPVASYINTQLLEILTYARRYDEAIERAEKFIELKPDDRDATLQLIRIYALKGMGAEAAAALDKFLATKSPAPPLLLARVYGQNGKKTEAEKILRESLDRYKDGDNCFPSALYAVQLGDKRRALDFLEKAYQRREPPLLSLAVAPDFDSLRGEPRFRALLERIGLPR